MTPEGAIVIMVGLALVVIAWATGQLKAMRQNKTVQKRMGPVEAAKALLRENKEDHDAESPYSVWILCSESKARSIAQSVPENNAEEFVSEAPPILLVGTEDGRGEVWVVSERDQFEVIKRISNSKGRVGALPNRVIQLTDNPHLKKFYDLIRPETRIFKRQDEDWLGSFTITAEEQEPAEIHMIQGVLNSQETDFVNLLAAIWNHTRERAHGDVHKVWIICENLEQANDVAGAFVEAKVVDKLPHKILNINPATKRGRAEIYLLSDPEHHGDILRDEGTPTISSVIPNLVVCLPGEGKMSEFKDQIGNLEKADTVTPN